MNHDEAPHKNGNFTNRNGGKEKALWGENRL